ncbi:hypothetical protein [Spartinivicinus poritis]|nr:hypothetical protein [Spartinivicinus sp. A2-2]
MNDPEPYEAWMPIRAVTIKDDGNAVYARSIQLPACSVSFMQLLFPYI